jgi:RNA polymerase sigma-70 factor (ECF subfamily)
MDEAVAKVQTLYQEHGASLLTYLRRRVGDRAPAEDLLQETFLQALRRPHRVAEAASPRAWLFTVAKRVAATALRRRRPMASLSRDVAAGTPSRVDPRLEATRQAIAALPDPQQEVLQLRLRHDLSYQEIAAVLEIPVGTVRSRIHSAMRRLRDRLGPTAQ